MTVRYSREMLQGDLIYNVVRSPCVHLLSDVDREGCRKSNLVFYQALMMLKEPMPCLSLMRPPHFRSLSPFAVRRPTTSRTATAVDDSRSTDDTPTSSIASPDSPPVTRIRSESPPFVVKQTPRRGSFMPIRADEQVSKRDFSLLVRTVRSPTQVVG